MNAIVPSEKALKKQFACPGCNLRGCLSPRGNPRVDAKGAKLRVYCSHCLGTYDLKIPRKETR